MPLTTAFLTTCRTAIPAVPAIVTFRAAGVLANETRAERVVQWSRLYATDTTGTSAAHRARQAIRDLVNAQADISGANGSGVVTALERESAYQTLIGEFVPVVARPLSDADESGNLTRLINEAYRS